MASLDSGYLEIDVKTEAEDGSVPDLSISIFGDFQTPDRSHLTMGISSGGNSITLETIAVGEKSFVMSPLSGAWVINNESLTPFESVLDFGAFKVGLGLQAAEGFTLVSQGQLGGEQVYRMKGIVVGEALADLLDDPQVKDGKGEVEFWIGIEDSLVRKMTLQVEPTSGSGSGGLKMQIEMTLSAYGKPVDIQVPEF